MLWTFHSEPLSEFAQQKNLEGPVLVGLPNELSEARMADNGTRRNVVAPTSFRSTVEIVIAPIAAPLSTADSSKNIFVSGSQLQSS